METKRVKAMRNGKVKLFSQMTWDIAHPETQGWQKVGEMTDAIMVETEEIPIIKTDIEVVDVDGNLTATATEVVAEPTQQEIDDDLYPTNEEIRVYLNKLFDEGAIDKPPHHLAGTKKLRAMYDESSK